MLWAFFHFRVVPRKRCNAPIINSFYAVSRILALERKHAFITVVYRYYTGFYGFYHGAFTAFYRLFSNFSSNSARSK